MSTQPTTKEWLRQIGFSDFREHSLGIEIPNKWTNCCKSYLVCGDYLNAADCPWEIETVYEDGTIDRAMIICDLPTQDEVSALCKVLRVNVNLTCRICGGRGSIEEEDGVWICPCHSMARKETK